MLGLLIPRKVYIWAAVAALVASGVMYMRYDAAQDERRRIEAARLKHEAQTHERIRDAIADPRTPDNIRQRLRALAE